MPRFTVSFRCGIQIPLLYPSLTCHFRGLLGGHVAADVLKNEGLAMDWYDDELLDMAKDIGERLMPAFNTTTGIPYPKVFFKPKILMSTCCSVYFSTNNELSMLCLLNTTTNLFYFR